MKTCGKLVGGFVVASVLVSLTFWYMDRESYTWPNQVTETAEREGWRLVGVTKVRHLTRPWTWLWPSPAVLAFVQPSSVEKWARRDTHPKGTLIVAPTLWFTRFDDGKVRYAKQLQAYDCRTKQYALLADENQSYQIVDASGSATPGMWYPIPEQIAEYFCR